MANKRLKFFLLVVVLVFFVTNFVFAVPVDCGQYTGTNSTACTLSSPECVWRTSAEDPWCPNPTGCCMGKGCWLYAGTNQTACETYDETLSCIWDSSMMNFYSNGSVMPTSGGCVMNWSGNDQGWQGASEGCWNNDGNKAVCGTSGCSWSANDQNQNPWCMIKSLTDAQNKNPSATISDIGCCQQSGCWVNDNNESACNIGFQGNCFYSNNSYGGGWCNTKSCNEITTEANCTYTKQTLMMPCNWTGAACSGEMYGVGALGSIIIILILVLVQEGGITLREVV